MEDKQEDFDYDRYFRSYREIDNYIENYIAMSSINIKNIKEEEIEAMGSTVLQKEREAAAIDTATSVEEHE